MTESLRRRRIDITFTLLPTTSASTPNVTTNPTFAEGGNQVTLTNHRATVAIAVQGQAASAQLRVYGLTQSLLNQFSTLGRVRLTDQRTAVAISAGDDDAGMGVVFQGTLTGAWADYTGMPQVPLHVTARSGASAQLAIIPPSSYRDSADVAVIISNLAGQAGLAFENGGVTTKLANPYFPGSVMAQIAACARAARIEYVVENGVLAIWPRDGSRSGQIPLINPKTGLIGYPTFTGRGIAAQCLFNPNLRFGGRIRLESELPQANGHWSIYDIRHELDAGTPGGAWFTAFQAQALTNADSPALRASVV